MNELCNIPGHVLYYKLTKSDGTYEWVPIPVVVNAETVYDFYKQYCIKNNIPIVRIPYYKLDTLNINDILLDTFLVK